jgi:hypothetical protein
MHALKPAVSAALSTVLDGDETLQFAVIVVAVRYASGIGPSKMTTAVGSRLGRIWRCSR